MGAVSSCGVFSFWLGLKNYTTHILHNCFWGDWMDLSDGNWGIFSQNLILQYLVRCHFVQCLSRQCCSLLERAESQFSLGFLRAAGMVGSEPSKCQHDQCAAPWQPSEAVSASSFSHTQLQEGSPPKPAQSPVPSTYLPLYFELSGLRNCHFSASAELHSKLCWTRAGDIKMHRWKGQGGCDSHTEAGPLFYHTG